ncbi:MAG TPA: GGDEF domain-containing protein [Thermoanaerobaculia bacterium]|nr:GGDEF domain-containing protein [Thermoanaerobaculia bacterium]
MEMAREGELLVARARLWVAGILLLIPLSHLAFQGADPEPWVGLGAGIAILIVGTIIKVIAGSTTPPRWLGLVSCLLDVTILSAANAAFVLAGQPLAATSGRVFFCFYLLALSLTCLRHEPWLCVLTGAAAIVQYGAIVIWAASTRGLLGPAFASTTYGQFRWDNQAARVAILALATAINVIIVIQTRKYATASIHDLLTGLPNRRYAEARLIEAISMAGRTKRTAVLAIGDLDRFKEVNDRYGHAAGDEVLRHTAGMLGEFFRASDVIARIGGEEFLIFFPETELDGALDRLREFHAAFANRPVILPGPLGMTSITISIGVAAFPVDGGTPAELLARADERLYAAKRAGRNRLHES